MILKFIIESYYMGLQVNAALGWPERAVKAAVDAGVVPADANILAIADVYAPRGAAFFFTNTAFLNLPLAEGKTVCQTYLNYKKPEPPVVQQPPVSIPPASNDYSPPSPSVTNVVYTAAPNSNSIFQNNVVGAAASGNELVTGSASSILVSSLTADTAYSLYVEGYGSGGQSTVRKMDFTTASANPTVTAAVYSAAISPGHTVNITVSFADASKLYYVIPNDPTPPPLRPR